MKKIVKLIFLDFIIIFGLSYFNFVSAVGMSTKGIDLLRPGQDAVTESSSQETPVGFLGGKVVKVVSFILGFSSLFVFGIAMYSGGVIILSKGNPETYKKGLNMLKTTIIGLLIIVFSYAIVKLIIVNILNLK